MKNMIYRVGVTPLLLLLVVGCGQPAADEKPPKAPPTAASPPTPVTRSGPSAGEVFQRPNPTGPAHDPRMITAQDTTERINGLLTAARDRLSDMRIALASRKVTDDDLRKAAVALKSLSSAARADCDAMTRAALDLQNELRYATGGYKAAADLYRERAGTYQGQAFRAITLKRAEEFDRLAADVPRRVKLTEEFLGRLVEMRAFLSEADRCLSETQAALAILSAGADPVAPSPEARVFREHLEVYLGVVADYQDKLVVLPARGSPASSGAGEKPPAPKDPPAGLTRSGVGLWQGPPPTEAPLVETRGSHP